MDAFDCDTIHEHFGTTKERMLATSPMLTSHACSSAYLSLDTEALLTESSRRQSFASSESSIRLDVFSSPSTGTMSPTTPITSGPPSTVAGGAYLKNAASELNLQTMCGFSTNDFDGEEDTLWLTTSPKEEAQPNLYANFISMENASIDHALAGAYTTSYYPVLSNTAMDQALSLPIFSESRLSESLATNDEDFAPWMAAVAQTPPCTIAPNATFHPMLASTPAANGEPTTPLRSVSHSLVSLSSSPLANYSSGILPSQPELQESPFSIGNSLVGLELGDLERVRRATSRLTRRQYSRKGVQTSSRTPRFPTNKTGFNCDEVIPQNEFACKYKDCIDKDTGRQKRFKRQEHKKRHEKTVHEKEKHNQYPCWVAQCKTAPFSRTDNLKSHLQKTHGKKSANARNRYVATQDKNSEFYDPEWIGELTDEGYPIFHRIPNCSGRGRP